MNIGYGSISIYDSLRYNLIYDDGIVYFIDNSKTKYTIKLPQEYIQYINGGSKIWVSLSRRTPKEIEENNITKFDNIQIERI
jgi:hypothetical protein